MLIACWVALTYCFQRFGYCGYLALRSATPRCGKTKLLRLLAHLVKGAPISITTCPTAAVLYRRFGTVLLLDEVDRLRNRDNEAYGQVIGVRAVHLDGPRGSVTVHNCRTVHGSPASVRDGGRPLLLNAFSAGDAYPYTPHPDPSEHAGVMVRGQRARWARHDPRPCLVPPDWSGGYTSIFAAQASEEG